MVRRKTALDRTTGPPVGYPLLNPSIVVDLQVRRYRPLITFDLRLSLIPPLVVLPRGRGRACVRCLLV